jgi:hypothetical protein
VFADAGAAPTEVQLAILAFLLVILPLLTKYYNTHPVVAPSWRHFKVLGWLGGGWGVVGVVRIAKKYGHIIRVLRI